MILFVFEGENREPKLYNTLERLYFPKKNDNILCSFGNNIYELYQDMANLDDAGNIVDVLKARLSQRGDHSFQHFRHSQFSEIYLFFDYDFQNSTLSLEENNKRVKAMLELFNEETENGKLYINYPMIESIRYTKELPDENYASYTVTREECHNFKQLAAEFSPYDNLDYLLFDKQNKPSKAKYDSVRDNWLYLKEMNVNKANYIVMGHYAKPKEKSDINQLAIFENQKTKYVDENESVSVLNSFPIFIYDYFE